MIDSLRLVHTELKKSTNIDNYTIIYIVWVN